MSDESLAEHFFSSDDSPSAAQHRQRGRVRDVASGDSSVGGVREPISHKAVARCVDSTVGPPADDPMRAQLLRSANEAVERIQHRDVLRSGVPGTLRG